MNYAGKCANGHAFQGELTTPKGIGNLPKSFAERCPVPYCPKFITYKPKKEVTMDDTRQEVLGGIHQAIDELMVLNRRVSGVLGYDTISDRNLAVEMREMARRFRELQRILEP